MKNVEQRPKKSNIKGDFQAFELALKLAKIFFLFSQVSTHCAKKDYFSFIKIVSFLYGKDVTGDFFPNFGTNFPNFSQCDPL